jgi:hypothetical protein
MDRLYDPPPPRRYLEFFSLMFDSVQRPTHASASATAAHIEPSNLGGN